jgi:hypothetical protein
MRLQDDLNENVKWSMKEKRCGKGAEGSKDRKGEAGGEVRRKEGSASQPILPSLLSSPHA